MLASFAPDKTRGRVYGFHRGMDHAGAVAGPLIATVYLYFYPEAYRSLFTWTLVPGIIVVLLILRLPSEHQRSRTPKPENLRTHEPKNLRTPEPENPRTWEPENRLRSRFYLAMSIIFLFALGNASDAFILLRLNDLGVKPVWIPLLWSALHVVKMSSSIVGGAMSDRFGRRAMIMIGYLWYAAIYAAFASTSSLPIVIGVFLAYGLYFGFTEGVEKAWVADMAPASARGLAFGIYNGALGLGGRAASLIFGVIWTKVSPHAAFLTGAALALAASVLLYLAFSHAKNSGH